VELAETSKRAKQRDSVVKAFLLAFVLVAGCATGINRTAQTVATSLHIVSDAEQAMLSADAAEKQTLVDAVKKGTLTQAGAESNNATWESKLARARTALHTLKDALVTASHVVDVVQHGGKGDYGQALQDVAQAYAALVQALANLGVHLPGLV
jgi:hypothetical protein